LNKIRRIIEKHGNSVMEAWREHCE
jgi:hypothetical protein